MTIGPWPIAPREAVVGAYRPAADATRESPYRTLRKQHCATEGVSVSLRKTGRAAGSVTVFSSLNIEAARLARLGEAATAHALVREANKLERGPDFAKLRVLLAKLAPAACKQVLTGVLPSEAPPVLSQVLLRLARRTMSAARSCNRDLGEVWALGRVVEKYPTNVRIELMNGGAALLSVRLAQGVHRDQLDAYLAIITDTLGPGRETVQAMPALDLSQPPHPPVSRFAHEHEAIPITAEDVKKLDVPHAPLRIFAPVHIEE